MKFVEFATNDFDWFTETKTQMNALWLIMRQVKYDRKHTTYIVKLFNSLWERKKEYVQSMIECDLMAFKHSKVDAANPKHIAINTKL